LLTPNFPFMCVSSESPSMALNKHPEPGFIVYLRLSLTRVC